MNKKSMYLKIVLGLAFLSLVVACGGDKTGSTTDNGVTYVSDGASGSKLVIELEDGGIEIPVAARVNFKVTATDPQGAPLVNIRLFCESEHGIAILEPSKAGVAFEHTGSVGAMSGVLGGLSPGSFLLECRGPQGFNLVTRKSFKVVGEIPQGFTGWPGAAGGNLGGGVFTDPLPEQVVLTQVTYITTGGDSDSRSGFIDNDLIIDCDTSTPKLDVEPFGPDQYSIKIENNFDQRISISSVEYVIDLRVGTVSALRETGGLVIEGNSSVDLTGVFTDTDNDIEAINPLFDKFFVGSTTPTPSGTFNMVFTVRGETVTGESFEETISSTVVIGPFNYCS